MIAQDVNKHPGSIVRIKTDGQYLMITHLILKATKIGYPKSIK